MSKKMLINASHPEENRVAIVVDGNLSELDIEIAGQEQTKGNIYKAVVVRVESGLQAAFVDYGAEKMGFLQIGEIHPSIYPDKESQDTRNRPRINDILQRGQEILVQIVKEERGTKGAALTTFLSLAGRYMVLMPDSKTKGVSRKITDESERKQLKKTMASLDLPERMGYIVRTAGIGKEKDELKRDFDYLVSLYQGIVTRKEQVKAPAQIYQESNLVIRSIRDYFSNEMDEVLIDDSRVYQETKDFFSLVMPEQVGLVKQHRERRPIFSRFQIEEQIDGLARNQIPLPSGGSIVIDQTEALVAIDVNSGKMSSESGIEATAGKTNLEAAAEVGRQLRLRDLGGLVVIDFIDMRDRKKIREVEQTLRASLSDDKAKVTVGRISQFGLLEMSRQRIKAVLSVGAYLDCPHCQGKGRIKTIEAQSVALLRQVHAAASKGHIGSIEARTPLNVASYLLNEKRAALVEMEKQLNLAVNIVGHPEFYPGQVELELLKREKPLAQDQTAAPISHANQIEGALAAATQETPETETPADSPATEETVAENGEESTGRKRRRRRRKRTRKEPGEQQSTPSETAEPESDQNQSDQAIEPVAIETGDIAVSGDPAPETTEPVQAKPRSRRRSKKPIAEKVEDPSTAPAAEESTGAEIKAEEKPKRRPRRKSPVKRSTEETTSESPATVTEPMSDSAEAETETKPKRPSNRRPAAREKTAESPVEKSESQAPETGQTDSEKPAGEDKPKRRGPRKTAVKKVTVEQSETPVPATQTSDPVSGESKPETKPKRRPSRSRAPKKTPVGETQTSQATATATLSAQRTDNNVEVEQKNQTSAPMTAEKKTDASLAVESKDVETPTADKPKRRPRRKPAAKAEKQTESPAKNTTDTSAPKADEKPKRRAPRKTATKKTEEVPDVPVKDQAEQKPKRRAPRKKTTKKTVDSASTE